MLLPLVDISLMSLRLVRVYNFHPLVPLPHSMSASVVENSSALRGPEIPAPIQALAKPRYCAILLG